MRTTLSFLHFMLNVFIAQILLQKLHLIMKEKISLATFPKILWVFLPMGHGQVKCVAGLRKLKSMNVIL